jgi:hypothetical protein
MLVINSVVGDTGRVQAVDAAVSGASYNFGQAYQSGKAVWTVDAVAASDTYNAGYRYDSGGRLRIYDATAGLPANTHIQSGVAVTDDGQVCISTDPNTDVAVLNGISLTADGAVFTDLS